MSAKYDAIQKSGQYQPELVLSFYVYQPSLIYF